MSCKHTARGLLCLLVMASVAQAQEGDPTKEQTDEAVVMAPSALSVIGLKEEYAIDEPIELVVKVPRQNVLRARAEVVLMHEEQAGAPIYQGLKDYDRFSDVQQLRFTLTPPTAERRGRLGLLVRVRGLRTARAEGPAEAFEEELSYRVRYADGGEAKLTAGKRLEGRVHFAVDSATLDDKAVAEVGRWANALKAVEGLAEIRVEGHADQLGRQNYNLALSRRRAEIVRDQLIASGVPGHLIQVIGFGFSRPVEGAAPQPGGQGVWENRRAEVVWFTREEK
ncbi:MAG: OmpA family protein [Bradymonadia bacterium]